MDAVQQKNKPHGSEGCCTNDRVSSTRGLRGSSDLGSILGGEENLVTPTVGFAMPNLHSCYWGGALTDPRA